jgi:hypothetical protein
MFVVSLVVLFCISAAFSHQSPVRSPDTEVGQPGSWPQQGGKKVVDVNDLKKQANELITMSQALPGQLDQLGNGKFPKELIDNLKKIEKQSKHIRGQVE